MSTTTLLVTNDLVLILLFLLWNYLSSYITEKGKNLATKEDIQEITTKVEAVRSQFAAQLEIQKSELDRLVDVHRLEFEWEFPVLRDLWAKINDVLAEAHWLQISSAQRVGSDPNKAEQRLSKFIDALEVCGRVNALNRPFLHEDVYKEVSVFMDLLSDLYNKAVGGDTASLKPAEYWAQADKDRAKILQGAERICETIRHRVAPAFHKG